jgi:hypothetical protein
MQYKLDTTEMILLQSLLDGNYFDDLIAFHVNDYVENITYEMAEPIIKQKYDNKINAEIQKPTKTKIVESQEESQEETEEETEEESQEETEEETEEESQQESQEESQDKETTHKIEKMFEKCIEKRFDTINSPNTNIWKRTFPDTSKEIMFLSTQDCTFALLMYIYFKHTKNSITIPMLKEKLVEKYNQVMEKHKEDILLILANQAGKKDMINRVRTKRIDLDALIKSEEYYLTNLDFWALASILNLPIILFSTYSLKSLALDVEWVTLGGNPETDSYFFLRSPLRVDKQIPEHIPSLIEPAYPLKELRENFFLKINNLEYVENNLTFETYLDYFRRKKK